MADIISMPKLGFDMAEGTLVRWVIGEGESVEKGGILAEIETDKATVEVESSHEGTIRRHLVNEGDVVPVGEPIAIIGSPDENIDDLMPGAEEIVEAGEAAPGAVPQKDIAAGGEAKGEETPAMLGEIKEKGAEETERISPEIAKETGGEPYRQVEEAETGVEGLPGGVRASPVARRMAEEKGIDLRRINGSGPGGRIVKKDIETFKEAPPREEPARAPEAVPAKPPEVKERREVPAVPLPSVALAAPPEDVVIPLSRLRAAIGKRMAQSKQQAPHFYVTSEYDVARLLELREEVNALLDEGEKISVNDFVVKATALALRQFPNLNASLKGDQVIHYGQINVSIAVAVEGGLLTVVVKDADRKPLRQISIEAREMTARVREGKVRSDDIEGSTFSTSNLGMFGVEDFVAVINPPEAGILAFGAAKEVPVVENGEIKIGVRMKATISIDHRVSDGAEAARFMRTLGRYLEEPLSLLL